MKSGPQRSGRVTEYGVRVCLTTGIHGRSSSSAGGGGISSTSTRTRLCITGQLSGIKWSVSDAAEAAQIYHPQFPLTRRAFKYGISPFRTALPVSYLPWVTCQQGNASVQRFMGSHNARERNSAYNQSQAGLRPSLDLPAFPLLLETWRKDGSRPQMPSTAVSQRFAH